MTIYNKQNEVINKTPFFSKSFRKTPVVILIAIILGFAVMGWINAYHNLADKFTPNTIVLTQKLNK